MDITINDELARVEWTIIEDGIIGCPFGGNFEFGCAPVDDADGGVVRSGYHQFTNCPITTTVNEFTIRMKPQLSDDTPDNAVNALEMVCVYNGKTVLNNNSLNVLF